MNVGVCLDALQRAVDFRRPRRDSGSGPAQIERAAEVAPPFGESAGEGLYVRRAREEFLGLISHELRTPVTVIHGSVELLHKNGLNEEDRKAIISDLRGETRRLRQGIENLLVLARTESGTGPQARPSDIRQLLRAQARRHRQLVPDREVEVRVADALPPAVCDPMQVELVLVNLLSNAEKYSPRGQPIEIEAYADSQDVVVKVHDRGRSVPAEEVELLFTPFYRSPSSVSLQGMGIGLAACKLLLEAQGGGIAAGPRQGGGSTFQFSLPAAVAVNEICVDEPQQFSGQPGNSVG
jgi:two-component system, OmpR family, sensor histidine kinase KdpD